MMTQDEINKLREKLEQLNRALSILEPIVKGDVRGDEARKGYDELASMGYTLDNNAGEDAGRTEEEGG